MTRPTYRNVDCRIVAWRDRTLSILSTDITSGNDVKGELRNFQLHSDSSIGQYEYGLIFGKSILLGHRIIIL